MDVQTDTIRIAVIGLGGLGCPAVWALISSWYSTRYLELSLVDADSVSLSNLNRQILFGERSIGQTKPQAIVESLQKLIPGSEHPNIELKPVEAFLSPENCNALLDGQHYVIDATDSAKAKFLINDFCFPRGIPFCYAGVRGNYGQLLAINPRSGPDSACLRCVFADFTEEDYATRENECRHQGIIGAVSGILGMFQANAALSHIEQHNTFSGEPSVLIKFTLSKKMRLDKIIVRRDANCTLHSEDTQESLPGDKTPVALDLSDKLCPLTFLYTKLALEKLCPGATLLATYSSKDSTDNVRESCIEEGYAVSSTAHHTDDGFWQLEITKPKG